MQVKLWAMRTESLETDEASRLLNALPPALQERLRMANGTPRQQSLWAYSLLRFALCKSYDMELPDIVWSAQGKPGFAEQRELFFNLSHTEGAVLVGISNREIGVDMEKEREAPARLKAFLRTDKAFFSEWVRWEACAKCMGSGVLPLLRKGTLPEAVSYQAVETFPGYWAGAAVMGKDEPVEVCFVEREQLLPIAETVAED